MKKYSYLFSSLITICLIPLSCSSDAFFNTNEEQLINQIRAQDVVYPLSAAAFITAFDAGNNIYTTNLYLYSNGISFDGSDFSGIGEIIVITINSTEESIDGVYEYEPSSVDPGTISTMSYFINFDIGLFTGDFFSIIEGTLNIESGVITFTGIDDFDNEVFIYYNGMLTPYNP